MSEVYDIPDIPSDCYHFLEHTILSITESANGIDNFNWAAIRIKDPDKIGTRVSVRSAGDNFLD